MKTDNLRTLIRESINEYIKEIDDAAETAAMEARIAKCDEAIAARESKLARIDENDELKEMIDGAKIKEIQNEIKELKNAKLKFERIAEKKAAKKAKKSAPKEEEVVTDAVTEEDPIDETDVMAGMNVDEETTEEALNESFIKMQKLAGVITETQYNEKKRLIENQLNEGYKFNDASEDIASEIEAKIKPAIESTLKKAMIDVATKNPELKGAPNYGLAIGLIAYQIVMDSMKD
jgi:hypothetical protein